MLKSFFFNIRMSFRMWVRNRTRPLTIEEAEEKKLLWSKIYALCGGAIFVFATASLLMNCDTNFSKSLPVHKNLIEQMDDNCKFRVIEFSGFKKVNDKYMTKKEAIEMRDAERSIYNNVSEEVKE